MDDTMLAILDIILRKVKKSNIYMGGVLLLFTMDHLQIKPINGRPFLTSANIIPCFKMVNLQHSMRAWNDQRYQRIQQIARMHYKEFETNPRLVDEFVQLCSESFTFVDSWDDDEIHTGTMRLYSKRVPARDAARQFVDRVTRQVPPNERLMKLSEDLQKNRYSHQEWREADRSTSDSLEQYVKEPRELLFFRGAVYQITFNVEGQFSNTQLVMLFDLPTEENLNNWQNIKVLKFPPGVKDIDFDQFRSKQSYIDDGFVEISVGVAPERTKYVGNDIQATRKQYGLKHHVSSTIHQAMGDTLTSVATEISIHDPNFMMWDDGQMVVITSRTRYARQTIFVGDKNETLAALKRLLTSKSFIVIILNSKNWRRSI